MSGVVIAIAVFIVAVLWCRIARGVIRGLRSADERVQGAPEWCGECGTEIYAGWALYEAFGNDGDFTGLPGGSGMSAHYCDEHRPDGAVPWAA